MATIVHQLRNLLEEIILKEIGEGSSKPYPYKKVGSLKYSFIARLGPDDKHEVKVDFQTHHEFSPEMVKTGVPIKFKNSTNMFNLEYSIGGTDIQFQPSTAPALLRILSTIYSITKEFIEEYSPDLLYVEPTPKTSKGSPVQKSNLYRAFIWKQLDKIQGYDADQRHQGFIIYKSE